MKRILRPLVLSLILSIFIISCEEKTGYETPFVYPEPQLEEPENIVPSFTLTSPSFDMDEAIPMQYACHGQNVSPPLIWSSPPDNTQSFTLIMDDPDAIPVAGFVWDHWLLFNIPEDARSLPEGIANEKELPNGSSHGTNSFKRLGYGGPCPPSSQTHRYVFTLYALDTILDLEPGATKDQILEAMDGYILGEAKFSGSYTSP